MLRHYGGRPVARGTPWKSHQQVGYSFINGKKRRRQSKRKKIIQRHSKPKKETMTWGKKNKFLCGTYETTLRRHRIIYINVVLKTLPFWKNV